MLDYFDGYVLHNILSFIDYHERYLFRHICHNTLYHISFSPSYNNLYWDDNINGKVKFDINGANLKNQKLTFYTDNNIMKALQNIIYLKAENCQITLEYLHKMKELNLIDCDTSNCGALFQQMSNLTSINFIRTPIRISGIKYSGSSLLERVYLEDVKFRDNERICYASFLTIRRIKFLTLIRLPDFTLDMFPPAFFLNENLTIIGYNNIKSTDIKMCPLLKVKHLRIEQTTLPFHFYYYLYCISVNLSHTLITEKQLPWLDKVNNKYIIPTPMN